MTEYSRRRFLTTGLCALGAGGLTLDARARPTPPSGSLATAPPDLQDPKRELQLTEDNILGPYYRGGAPYRAKVTPPNARGTTLLIRGRVWGLDTKRPLPGATLDIWQADASGRYDNDDSDNPPKKGVYLCRSRVLTDEQGGYEYETVHPGRYRIGPEVWRPAHIHYLIAHSGYRTLITQLYFEGDRHNDGDAFIKKSLIIPVEKLEVGRRALERGIFDIVLAPV